MPVCVCAEAGTKLIETSAVKRVMRVVLNVIGMGLETKAAARGAVVDFSYI